METFVQEPENIAQQNLGTLAGIFEVSDRSEDSSYIVNYLISIIKKEYHSQIKRGPIESFEAALHKANLALAKLAQHGNIGWIGKLDGILLAIEKNNIHLSQAGGTHAFLLRSKTITNITENPEQEKTASPLKTFADVVSGRLENNDKFIIAAQNIFDIFSLEEIKRSALKFSASDFVRFLKTALVNELERSAVLIADIAEKIEVPTEEFQPQNHTENVFSQTAFSKVRSKRLKNSEKPMNIEEKKTIDDEIQDEMEKAKGEFVDKKTGHIYIKENQYLKENPLRRPADSGEKIYNLIGNGRIKLAEFISFFKKNGVRIIQKISGFKFPRNFNFNLGKLKPQSYSIPLLPKDKILSGARAIFSKISPQIGKVKAAFMKLDYPQKLYAALAVMLIILVPYFVMKAGGKNKAAENVPPEVPAVVSIPLEQDKNVVRVENLNSVYSGDEISEIINLNSKIFAIGANEIIDLENKENYPIPDGFKPVKISAGMDDLNLIFLIGENNKIVSWSPTSKKFQENQISFLENSSLVSAKTYLTYLYVLDSANNQIYRYPRAEGGFGAPSAWLKENIDLSQIKDMALSDNLYLTGENNIIKFYRGKKQDFQIENTATVIQANKIYAQRDSQNIYLLDKVNSRIIKLDLNGNIVSQFYNSEIFNTISFTVNEENNLIFFNSDENIKSFEMK